MTRLLYVDVIGGAAGDMLLAALLDAGAPMEPVRLAVEAVLPGRFAFRTEDVLRAGTRAAYLRIEPGPAGRDNGGTGEGTGGGRSLRELLDAVGGAGLRPAVLVAARSVLERLGAAEDRIHGTGGLETTLHSIGDDDTLLDVVGVSAALDAMGIERVLVSAVPLESGGLLPERGGHPPIPLPAPSTLELLRGFRTRPGGPGEVVTPTAAAICAALAEPSDAFPAMAIELVGYGAGTRDPSDRPNVVRVVVGTAAPDPGPSSVDPMEDGEPERELVLMEANLDDLTPELVAEAQRALLAAGALDAWTTAATMKKGRSGVVLSALVEPAAEDRLREVYFETTSTFGVRSLPVRRAELERRTVRVTLADGEVRVKIGMRAGRVMSATPEHDDVAAVAERAGRPVRHVYEEAVAAGRAALMAPAGE